MAPYPSILTLSLTLLTLTLTLTLTVTVTLTLTLSLTLTLTLTLTPDQVVAHRADHRLALLLLLHRRHGITLPLS